jgi:hypothetical protein
MYHVISVGMNSELLTQLDELREVYPGANRAQILAHLIGDAHAALVASRHPRAANDDEAFHCPPSSLGL